LLDEATSALDRKNEKLIQNTLNEISQGLTTVTVAHRVKTIMNSDIVYVIDRGQIVEKGEFNKLKRYQNIPAHNE
jgi:ATP-binding cassette, subfamily B (MDR/TAP), member 1